MVLGQDTQLKKVVVGAMKSGHTNPLEAFLQRVISEGAPLKCPQTFLIKLDKSVHMCLDQKDFISASQIFAVISKCGENLELPGGGLGLPGLIGRGLIKKWFDKCRQLWIQRGPEWDEGLFNLSEDFFDALSVVHESCKEGTYKITESFLYPLGQLAINPRIYILIQKEAIRAFNQILDQIPAELKKEQKILTSQASDIMIKLAGHILEGGDYDLQTAMSEALCRMATPVQRKELADCWFGMECFAKAFSTISDSEFETDCRKFLNMVNGMRGEKRRVCSYPCLDVHLDQHELLIPADEKLEEFWIDFNLGSHSISFYFSLENGPEEAGQWETICINENEVDSYTVTVESKRKVLEINLLAAVHVSAVEGSRLTIHFSPTFDILHAVRSIYGDRKNKGFIGKTTTSVVKTTVKILTEENSSQVVPESQMPDASEETICFPLLSTPLQMQTPAKMRISESTTFISNSAGGSVHSAGSLSAVMQSYSFVKGKGKLPLFTVGSCDRQDEVYLKGLRTGTHGTATSSSTIGSIVEQRSTPKTVNMNHIDKHQRAAVANTPTVRGEEQSQEANVVPDTQPILMGNKSYSCKLSISEMLTMPTQKINPPDLRSSTVSAPDVLLALRGDLSKGKTKTEATPNKAPTSTSTSKRVLTNRETRDAKVTESMMKHISSHYKTKTQVTARTKENVMPPLVNRPIFGMSWLSATKNETCVATSLMKSFSKRTNTSRKDVFAFSLGTPSTIRGKRHVKKHLFSDSDTDHTSTEVSWLKDSGRKPKPTTKYLRQEPFKPPAEAPQTACESPGLPFICPKTGKNNTMPKKKLDLKRVEQPKKAVKPVAATVPSRPQAASSRPRRAAASFTKSYKEPDTDDSQSESEQLPTPKHPDIHRVETTDTIHQAAPVKRKSVSKPQIERYGKIESVPHRSLLASESRQKSNFKQQRPFPDSLKLHKKKVTPIQEQTSVLKESLAARQASFLPSPPFIEKMRSAERSVPTLGLPHSPLITPQGSPIPASPDPACKDTPSPILLLHKPCSAVSSNGNFRPPSHHSAEKKCSTSRVESIQSVTSLSSLRHRIPAPSPPIEISPYQQCLSLALQTPLSLSIQPILTSTSNPSPHQSPSPKDAVSNDNRGMAKVSSVTGVSLSQSSSELSVLRGRVKKTSGAAPKKEKTPTSDHDEQSDPLVSGPRHKRHKSESSDSEEDEKEVKGKSKMQARNHLWMKPRKLFKSLTEVSVEDAVNRTMSSSHTVSSVEGQWKAEEGSAEMDMDENLEMPDMALSPGELCSKFSSDLKNKFQSRCKMVDVHNKQSLKTLQQHVSSFNVQVTAYRTQRLEQVKRVLSDEIHKLEQSDIVLRTLEKDLTIFRNKQAVAFHSYQEQEVCRNETLKNVLQGNTCHSLEYEKKVFTSQMCLMRKDMKSVQDRLLSQMQDDEIQSVKKGLTAMFFSGGVGF